MYYEKYYICRECKIPTTYPKFAKDICHACGGGKGFKIKIGYEETIYTSVGRWFNRTDYREIIIHFKDGTKYSYGKTILEPYWY